MKKLIFSATLLTGVVVTAQDTNGKVGINTKEPKATLEIQPNATNLAGTTNEGLLIPRLSKERVAKMTAPVESTLVYVTDDVSDADKTNFTGTGKGFYYYDATSQKWIKQSGQAGQLWAQRSNQKEPSVTDTYLTSAESNQESLTYKQGSLEGIFKSVKDYGGTNVAVTDMSAYGFRANRYNNVGYGPALALRNGRGTIENPEGSVSGDQMGRILFQTVKTDKKDYTGAWVLSSIKEVKNNDFSTALVLGAKSIGKNNPNYTLTIDGDTDAVGIGTSPELGIKLDVAGVVRTSKLQSSYSGTADLGGYIESIHTGKTGNDQISRWTLANIHDLHPGDNTQGYNSGLALIGYNSKNEMKTNTLFIADNGNVGIGGYMYKGATIDHRLQVAGSAAATGFVSTAGGTFGGSVQIENTDKKDPTQMSNWVFRNMNASDKKSGEYKNGLSLWAYSTSTDGSSPNSSPVLFINDNKNVGIGPNYQYAGNADITERLEVDGSIKSTNLKGTGNRPVFADANGVLTVGAAGATTVLGTENLQCNEENRGKMNFQKDVSMDGGKGDAWGVCLKGTDGNFYWRYLYGASGATNNTGAFGSGL